MIKSNYTVAQAQSSQLLSKAASFISQKSAAGIGNDNTGVKCNCSQIYDSGKTLIQKYGRTSQRDSSGIISVANAFQQADVLKELD